MINKNKWRILKWISLVLCLLAIPYAIRNVYAYTCLGLVIIVLACSLINTWLDEVESR
jgi:hypothetical protein